MPAILGQVFDTSGQNNHGRADGGVEQIEGKIGSAGNFDGVDDAVTVPHNSSLNLTDFSIACWVKTTQSPDEYRDFVSKRGGGKVPFSLYLAQGGKVHLEIYDGTNNPDVESDNALNDGQWHHIVGIRKTSDDKLYLYVDGALQIDQETDTTTQSILNDENVKIGVRVGYYFQGQIDEVCIYNRALTSAEVQAVYKCERVTSGLVAEWKFEPHPYRVMTWDSDYAGWEDDSFASGWNAPTWITATQDGDIIEVKTNAGYDGGAVEKTGFSVNAASYKYLVICVKGNAKRYTEIYDGSWKWVEGSYQDAPSEYEILIYNLSSITTGTVTGIRLGVYGGELKSAWYDFVAFCSAQPQFCIDRVLSLYVSQRESDIDEFELATDHQDSSPFVHGRHVRVWLEATKIFAGIIEEVTPVEGHMTHVGGRCFGQKILLRTKSKDWNGREVSLAVKDLVEDLSEVTNFQVETPSPTVAITKSIRYEYIIDGLGDLAKHVGSGWETKLGMGQDLRFRSRSSPNVKTSPTSIVEGVNALRGVNRQSDALRLYNKVIVVGGPLCNPDGDPDAWTESTEGWSVSTGSALSAVSGAPVGQYYLRLQTINQDNAYCERNIESFDSTKFQSLKLYCGHTLYTQQGYPWELWIRIGQGFNNCRSFPLSALGGPPERELIQFTIPLDHPSWQTTGSPNMTAVSWICINPVSEDDLFTGSVNFDGIHFYAPNMVKTAVDDSSEFSHIREYVHRDDKLIDPDFAQEVANALLAVLKSKENRYRIPVLGSPSLQDGMKVSVNLPSHGLSDTYYICEAVHRVSPNDGYVTEVVLEAPSLTLESLLAQSIQRQIKRLERSGIS